MTLIIRSAQEDEFLRIYDFVSQCPPLEKYSEHFYKIMLRYFSRSCVVAEQNNTIVGYAMGFQSQVDTHKFFLWQIGVAASQRRTDAAKRVLANIQEAAADLGCTLIELTVDPENIASQRFFEKQGYRNVSITEGDVVEVKGTTAVKDYYKPGRHFTVFQKKISSYVH